MDTENQGGYAVPPELALAVAEYLEAHKARIKDLLDEATAAGVVLDADLGR